MIEIQEKLFEKKRPLGKIGETHITEFSDIPRVEKPNVEAFESDGHGKPEVIKILRGKSSPERRKLIDDLKGDDLKLEKHISKCAQCRYLADHPESIVQEASLLE